MPRYSRPTDTEPGGRALPCPKASAGRAAVPDRPGGSAHRAAGHCGSTSTLTLTPPRATPGATASTAEPTASIAAWRAGWAGPSPVRVVALTTSWLRQRLRSRNSGAGPSSVASPPTSRAAITAAASEAGACSAAEQTTRISDAYGG